MSRSAQSERWNHTANYLAMLFNINRDPKRSSPLSPNEVHPFEKDNEPVYSEEQKTLILKEKFAVLKERVFGGREVKIKPFIPANIDPSTGKKRKT